MEQLRQAVARFDVEEMRLVCDDDALAAARASLRDSGLLLLGESHGVAENPRIIAALLHQLGVRSLALEWEEELRVVLDPFLSGAPLADDPERMWFGDGRLTAGHFAVLRELHAAGPLDLILFVGVIDAELTADGEVTFDWSQHDREMAERILAATVPGRPTLVVAGNAHTATEPHEYGTPMGACLLARRPGVREIRARYRGGFYSVGPGRFDGPETPRPSSPDLALRLEDGALVLDVSAATEAIVPHLPRE